MSLFFSCRCCAGRYVVHLDNRADISVANGRFDSSLRSIVIVQVHIDVPERTRVENRVRCLF